MATYYDRYSLFKVNNSIKPIPGIFLNKKSSDKTHLYKLGETRLDKLSQMYYNNPYHGWLIMLANPQYGGLEFDIKDRDIIIIPYPFDSAIERYLNEVKTYKTLYGEN